MRPAIRCSTFGNVERMRVPSPAASTIGEARSLQSYSGASSGLNASRLKRDLPDLLAFSIMIRRFPAAGTKRTSETRCARRRMPIV